MLTVGFVQMVVAQSSTRIGPVLTSTAIAVSATVRLLVGVPGMMVVCLVLVVFGFEPTFLWIRFFSLHGSNRRRYRSLVLCAFSVPILWRVVFLNTATIVCVSRGSPRTTGTSMFVGRWWTLNHVVYVRPFAIALAISLHTSALALLVCKHFFRSAVLVVQLHHTCHQSMSDVDASKPQHSLEIELPNNGRPGNHNNVLLRESLSVPCEMRGGSLPTLHT